MDKLDIEACKKENPFIVLADVIYKHLKMILCRAYYCQVIRLLSQRLHSN